jgi:hypothetical protein
MKSKDNPENMEKILFVLVLILSLVGISLKKISQIDFKHEQISLSPVENRGKLQFKNPKLD